jgi:eukaryotic-like serine/threonine-protein kinase
MMPRTDADARLEELLLRWEELHDQGRSVSPDELCSTCPELAEELGRRMALLRQLDPLVGGGASADSEKTRPEAAGGPSRQSATARAEFRDLRFHAAGGLGEVFLARNAELNRDVALKFLKPDRVRDADSRRRFIQEAEVTGRLEHPGVVPIYAVGTDATGAPCYAMRFIRGETLQGAIDAFHAAEKPGRDPSERSLALRELLNRFVSICNTIGYAHSRGILHRDLKPRNVMLGKYDETLVVDWGLAKPFERDEVAREIGEETLTPSSGSGEDGSETPTVGVVGTPAFMSPEQAEARWDLVGPASDIFALGGILYTILVGRPPYQGKKVGGILEKVKRCEFSPPRQIKPGVSQALEAICLKAMARRPEDRYTTALDLAADVRRWLAGEPVPAYPEPLVARARRWMRRHRTFVTSLAALSVFGLVVLTGFATAMAAKNRELDRQRVRAEKREALAIEAVKRFRDAVQANPELKDRPELDGLRKTLLKEPLEFYRKLGDQLQTDRDTGPEALAKLAAAYFDLASTTAEIGSVPDAIRSHAEALAIREQLARDHPAVVEYQSDLAMSHVEIGYLLGATGHGSEALESYRKALAIRERLASNHPAVTRYQQDLADSHNRIGATLFARGRTGEALEAYQKSLAIRERLARDDPTIAEYRKREADSLFNIGLLQYYNGPMDEALEPYRKALAIREQLAREYPTDAGFQDLLARCCHNIGLVFQDMDRPSKAIEPYQRAVAIWENLAREHPSARSYPFLLAKSYNNIGNLARAEGRQAEALESHQKAMTIRERLTREQPAIIQYQNDLAESYGNIGYQMRAAGRQTEAMESYRKALVILERQARDNPAVPEYRHQSNLGNALCNLAQIEMDQGHWGEALELLQRGVAHKRRAVSLAPEQPTYRLSLSRDLADLAIVHRSLAQPTESTRAARESASLADKSPAELYHAACALSSTVPLAESEQRQGLAAEAVEMLTRAIAAGWSQGAQASHDPDLDPIRNREDFRRLLAELFDRGFPAEPFAP